MKGVGCGSHILSLPDKYLNDCDQKDGSKGMVINGFNKFISLFSSCCYRPTIVTYSHRATIEALGDPLREPEWPVSKQ